eukprot:2581675-Heterocapsa_arctica.AAC.1
MGDHAAVAIALEAHVRLLQILCDALTEDVWVRGGRPLPASPFLELLVIDDHATLMQVPRNGVP